MLRFNYGKSKFFFLKSVFQYILCYGSTIQRFIRIRTICTFQYILCYGSTIRKIKIPRRKVNFNTSYVTVQRFLAARTPLGNHISIHPMLRFNMEGFFMFNDFNKFQYILCYGSTLTICSSIYKTTNFNTSYVTVQHLR